MISKPAPTPINIHELIKNRWSGRAFDASKRITEENLAILAEAARWTPSCMNIQPWRFIPALRGETATWTQVLDSLAASNQTWASQAPLLLTIAHETQFPDGKVNPWARYDTGAAAMALSIQATAMGLMVHQMGGIDADRLKNTLKLPDDWAVTTVLAIGYQLASDAVPESLKEREFGARSRRPIHEIWLAQDPAS
jgi:nitroreductase